MFAQKDSKKTPQPNYYGKKLSKVMSPNNLGPLISAQLIKDTLIKHCCTEVQNSVVNVLKIRRCVARVYFNNVEEARKAIVEFKRSPVLINGKKMDAKYLKGKNVFVYMSEKHLAKDRNPNKFMVTVGNGTTHLYVAPKKRSKKKNKKKFKTDVEIIEADLPLVECDTSDIVKTKKDKVIVKKEKSPEPKQDICKIEKEDTDLSLNVKKEALELENKILENAFQLNINQTSELIVGVTNEGGNLTKSQADTIHQVIKTAIVESCTKPNLIFVPIFRGEPSHLKGSLRLWCDDLATLLWLKTLVKNYTLPTGENLLVKSWTEILSVPNCTIHIKDKVVKRNMDIFTVLKRQNPWAKIESWKWSKTEQKRKSKMILVNVPEHVMPLIAERQCRLAYLCGSVEIRKLDK